MRFSIRCLPLAVLAVTSALSAAAQTTRNVPSQYATIQEAIDAAVAGDTVAVSGSNVTYHEHLTITGKSITLSAVTTRAVTLNGDGLGPVITISGAATEDTAVMGFMITNAGKPQAGLQGAINVKDSSPLIMNNTFTANFCNAVNATSSNVQIRLNQISGTLNTGCTSMNGVGSAIAVNGSDASASSSATRLQILENTITENKASLSYQPSQNNAGGAGINVINATAVTIADNVIANNTSTGYGGAIYLATTPQILIHDNVIYRNTGTSGGIDIIVPGSGVGPAAGALINNTIAYNIANNANAGSDLFIGGNLAQYQLVNNIIVGNTNVAALDCGGSLSAGSVTPLVLDHNDFYSTTGKPFDSSCPTPSATYGNVSVDPRFTTVDSASLSASTADFTPQYGSPVIDAGTNSGTFVPIASIDATSAVPFTDQMSLPRYRDTTSKGYATADMGAIENQEQITCSCVPLTLTHVALTADNYSPSAGGSLQLTARFFALISSSPTVSFQQDGKEVGTGTVSETGVATYTVTGLTAGLHVYTAVFSGSSPYAPTTSVYVPILVSAASNTNTQTVLSSSKNPSNVGDTVRLTATVTTLPASSTIPAGTVYFTDGGTALGNAVLDATGMAMLPVSTFTAGDHSLTAAFVPTGAFNGGTGALTQHVNAAALLSTSSTLSVTPLTATVDQEITFTAEIAPSNTATATSAPTGDVDFLVDGSVIASVTSSPSSGITASAVFNANHRVTAGPHTYSCQYKGDTVYSASSCTPVSGTVTTANSALTLTASTLTPYALTQFNVTAHLTAGGIPVSGPVTLSYNGVQQTLTTNTNGDASFPVSLPAGPATISAVATAATNYSESKATLNITALQNQTSGTLLAAPDPSYQGRAVNFVVTIRDLTGAPSPSGSVVLMEGATNVAAANLPAASTGSTIASVTIPVANLPVGQHTLTAVYQPDLNSLTAPIAPVTITVLASNFTVAADPTTITIQTQHHKGLTVNLASVGAFSGTVQLACATPLPPVLTCTFAQPIVSLDQNGTVSTSLNLETSAIANFYAANSEPRSGRLPFLAMGTLLAAVVFFRRRRGLRNVSLMVLALVGVTTVSGCSGHYPDHTPPGTYDIVIHALGVQPGVQTVTQTAHLTLIVAP